ncbi:MAG: hypothetical protein Q8J84_11045 [Flavobacteriaceae bacterium]|nr:hypothetical protein [Flavobacteriaceae bacterium]
MNTTALIMMVATQGIVMAITGYFFYLVLTSPKKPEPDSYDENDEVEEGKKE